MEKSVPGWPGWHARSDGSLRTPLNDIIWGQPSKNGHKFFFALKSGKTYPMRKWVHRFVAHAFVNNPRPDIFKEVDHIDRDPTNNRPTNLRWLNRSLNLLNNGASNAYYNKSFGKWRASVCVGGKTRNMGYYKTMAEASKVAHAFKHSEFNRIYEELVNETVTEIV